MSHILFMDESGNAGVNYLDAAQPFHVVAGVLVEAEHLSGFRHALDGHLTGKQGEVKGSQLMRTPKGQQKALRALEEMKRHATLFFVLMERRYGLVGKIVDVFLDPGLQDNVDWLSTDDIDQRRALTDYLLRTLPVATVDYFADVYRVPTRDGFEGVLRLLVTAVDDNPRLRNAFEGALDALDHILEQETYGDDETKHGDWAALNLPAFSHTVRMVDRYVDRSPSPVRIVHDQCAQFEPVLRRVLTLFCRPDITDRDFTYQNGEVRRQFLRHCGSMDMGDSKDEVGLRAADVLASTVARTAATAITNKPWTAELRALSLATLRDLWTRHPEGGQLRSAIDASAASKARLDRRVR